MIRVFIVSPEFLPIPAVMGGAVESLLTLFIEENERNKKIKLFVVSPREGIKKNEKKKYKNTKIIYLKSRGLIHKMYEWMMCKLSYKSPFRRLRLAAQIVMKVFQHSTLCCKIVCEKLHYKAREEKL